MKLEGRAQVQRLSSYKGPELGLRLTGPCGTRRKAEGPGVRAEGWEMLGPDHAELLGRPDSQVRQFNPEWGLPWGAPGATRKPGFSESGSLSRLVQGPALGVKGRHLGGKSSHRDGSHLGEETSRYWVRGDGLS